MIPQEQSHQEQDRAARLLIESLEARTQRQARTRQFRDNLQGVACSNRISQSAHRRVILLNLARSLTPTWRPTADRLPCKITTLEGLRALGCCRVVIEESGGHWARSSTKARGWCAWLHLWNGQGWVAWWAQGKPELPLVALRLDLEEFKECL